MKYIFEEILISDIKIDARFRVDYGDVEDLAQDIEVNGLYHPVLVNKIGKRLLAGGRRLAAFKHLQRDTIPAQLVFVRSKLQAREIELLENVMRKELDWQERVKLVREIDVLYRKKNPNWQTDKTAELLGRAGSTVRTAIQLAEAIELVPAIGNCKTEDEARKEFNALVEDMALQELASRPMPDTEEVVDGGEDSSDDDEKSKKKEKRLTALGYKTKGEQLIAFASTAYKLADVFDGLKKLRDGSVHFIECDGPYAVDLLNQKRVDVEKNKWNQYEEIKRADYPDFCNRLCEELFRVAADNTWVLFWYGQEHYDLVTRALIVVGFSIDPIPALWIKPSGQTQQPQMYLGRAYETFIVAAKGKPVLYKPGHLNHFDFTPVASADKFHPTQKPLDLYTELYETFCFPPPPKGPDWLILSAFAGSGAALLAAQKMGYRAMGFDTVKEYQVKYMAWVRAFWTRRTV